MMQTAEAEGLTPLELAARNSARFREMRPRSTSRSTDSSAPPSRATIARARRSGGDGEERRHLSRQLCRLVFGARRGLLRRRGNRRRGGRCAPRPAGLAGRMGRGEELFLQTVGLSGQTARALCEPAGFHLPRERRERSRELRQRRPEGPVGLAHHVRLGRQGAGRSRACDVCLGRCADQLHHRRRLSRREGAESGATGRPTCTSSARISSVSTRCTGRHS